MLAAGFEVYNPAWTRDEVLEVMRAWEREHGRWPTKQGWETTDGTHPSSATVRRMFGGSFTAAIREAGGQPAKVAWSDESILQTIGAWTTEHGRPPRPAEWMRSTPEHPCSATVKKRFGTWAAALDAAAAAR